MNNQQPLCAWCNKVPAGRLLDFGLMSHGICPSCSDDVMRELEVSKLNAMWAAPSKPEDSLGPARGIANGLLISVVLWGILAMIGGLA